MESQLIVYYVKTQIDHVQTELTAGLAKIWMQCRVKRFICVWFETPWALSKVSHYKSIFFLGSLVK